MKQKTFALFTAAALLLAFCAGCSPERAAGAETDIVLSDSGVQVDGAAASADPESAVYVGGNIIYYHDGTDETYGEGGEAEKHSAEEAAAHTVVTIAKPGVYRVSGKLSKGQLFIDLGEEAERDPSAVVTLILDDVDVTCTVAPAVFFYRVYECDTAWTAFEEGETSSYAGSGTADTTAAGANVLLAAGSENRINGSHVARIYKEGTTENLHRYDGAFYSCMSMNISDEGGAGATTGELYINADNEGLDTELHLTVNGGSITIDAQDDGINTNEDGVSVMTVNGGTLTVNGGLGAEGDGIDSNGYLTINGGTVWVAANERAGDGGLDADGDITINGGTVYAFGSRNDAVSKNSGQHYVELFLSEVVPAGSAVALTDATGETAMELTVERDCQSITLSSPTLSKDETYDLLVNGVPQEVYTGEPGGPMDGGRPVAPPDGQPPQAPDGEPPEKPDGAGQEPPSGDWPTEGGGGKPPEKPDGTAEKPGNGS